jgi:FkbM family methyltransferase
MLTVKLRGGLGNQLFQLAAVETIASETNRDIYILEQFTPNTVHSSSNYFETIFSNIAKYPYFEQPFEYVHEMSFTKQEWNLPKDMNVCVYGYFQDWRYVSQSFIDKLVLPACDILDGVFIHIRGGDYVNHSLHHVDLTLYYQKAIKHFPLNTHFYIFTNDIEYAKTFSFVEKINHTFVNENELMTLSMMSKCSKGAICANSTFSWWGAYLNRNRPIIMPSKWSHDSSIVQEEGYFFPGVSLQNVTLEKEMDIYDFIQNLDIKTFVEIGMHFGEDTKKFRIMHPNAHIIGFEPDPRNIKIIKDSDIDTICEFYPVALSNKNEEREFYMSSGTNPLPIDHQHSINDWSSSSSLKRPTGHLDAHKWVTFPNRAIVKCVRLDDVESIKDKTIDFIWVDVQGAEDIVFSGAKNTLSRTRYVYTEYATDLYEGQLNREQLLALFGSDWDVVHDFGGDILLKNNYM